MGLIAFLLTLIVHVGVPMRTAVGVLAALGTHLGISVRVPDWTTGRNWLLILGYFKLTRPKPMADDWVWLIDHTCQLGRQKGLLILGVRLSALPPQGQCLRLEHLEPLEVLPVTSSTKADVAEQLEAIVAKTGVPRAILRDDGGDLRGGVELFCHNHPETLDVYDIKHKTACVLRGVLEDDEQWSEFLRRLGQTRQQIGQTELAFLLPPSPRSKARYMNLAESVAWAERILRILEHPPASVLADVSVERLEEKLGWVREYASSIRAWSDLLDVIGWVEMFVRRDGLYLGAEADLELALPTPTQESLAGQVRKELLSHVREQSSGLTEGERLPGSTEILESAFGKYKHLEGEQSRGGLTSLLLALGALVGETTTELIAEAMESCPLKCVWRWCEEKLGKTFHGKRQEAFAM